MNHNLKSNFLTFYTGLFQDLHFSWNFEAAAVIFQEAKAAGKIPPEAFVK